VEVVVPRLSVNDSLSVPEDLKLCAVKANVISDSIIKLKGKFVGVHMAT
jgi:hypothetical protein